MSTLRLRLALAVNDKALREALAQSPISIARINELMIQRTTLKDMLIEVLLRKAA